MYTNMIHKLVSTHSRPKAAGCTGRCNLDYLCSFNTQPPEGGWAFATITVFAAVCFNTQPPEGGWVNASFCLVL